MNFNRTFFKRAILMTLSVLLAAQLIYFIMILYVGHAFGMIHFIDPPSTIKQRITISPNIQYSKQDFHMDTTCGAASFRLHLKRESEDEEKDKQLFDYFLKVNPLEKNPLPIDLVWDLYKKQDNGYQLVSHFDNRDRYMNGSNQDSMSFLLGYVQLFEGDYQARFQFSNPDPRLEWMNMDLSIGKNVRVKCR